MAKVLRRDWTRRDAWRDTKAGMWAWLIQRAAAVLLLIAIPLHVANPFRRDVRAALLALVLLHALLGVRSLVLDFGAPLRWHRPLLAAAVVLTVVFFAAVWRWQWY